jgi:hypothetical protein
MAHGLIHQRGDEMFGQLAGRIGQVQTFQIVGPADGGHGLNQRFHPAAQNCVQQLGLPEGLKASAAVGQQTGQQVLAGQNFQDSLGGVAPKAQIVAQPGVAQGRRRLSRFDQTLVAQAAEESEGVKGFECQPGDLPGREKHRPGVAICQRRNALLKGADAGQRVAVLGGQPDQRIAGGAVGLLGGRQLAHHLAKLAHSQLARMGGHFGGAAAPVLPRVRRTVSPTVRDRRIGSRTDSPTYGVVAVFIGWVGGVVLGPQKELTVGNFGLGRKPGGVNGKRHNGYCILKGVSNQILDALSGNEVPLRRERVGKADG